MSIKYVEYLQGDGNSYINTIGLPGGTYNIEMKYNDDTVNTTVQNRLISLTNNSFYYQINQYGVRQVKDSNRDNEQYVDKIVDNVLTDTFTIADNTSTLRIFYNLTVAQIYYIKLYDTSNNLLYHFRGALDNNNTPCLHETVNDVIYYNSGTGTFSHGRFIDALYLFANNNEGTAENLGSYRLYNMKIEGDLEEIKADEINYVDYLESDGASYIDLPGDTITYNDNFKIEVQCNRIPLCHVVGTSSDYGQTQTQLLYEGSTNFLQAHMYGARVCYTAYTNLVSGTGVETFILSPTSVYVNGTMLTSIETAGANHPTNNDFRIFGRGGSWDTQISKAGLRIYYVKLWNGDTLLYHLRACVDTEGVPCMYDEVSKQYFHNQGTGTFGYKEELRDFQPVLDSNGIPTLMDKINKKYYYDKNGKGFGCDKYSGVSYLVGDYETPIPIGQWTIDENTKIVFDIYAEGSFGVFTETQTKTGDYYSNTYSFAVRGSHYFNYYNNGTNSNNGWFAIDKYTVTIDKNGYSVGDTVFELPLSNTINANLKLFCQMDYQSNLYTEKCKLYYFKIYQSNELVLDLIPVLDNEGTPCMYDKISKQFFYNQGDGEFEYGIEESECPKANYVEYIGNNGNVKGFDTGLCFDNTWSKIEFKMYIGDCNFDTLISAGREYFNIVLNYGVGFFKCRTNGNLNPNQQIGVYESGKSMKLVECTLIYTPLNWNLNGVDYPVDVSSIDSSTVNIWIFCDMYDKCKLYYYKVWDSEGNLIQHLQPSLDKEGLPCLYDTINNNYIYGDSTMDYTYGKSIGYTPIKYIETNGTQYIDTSVIVNDNTYMDIDYRAIAKEYTQVEYLQGDGASWINTGLTITGTANYDMEIKYEIVDDSVSGVIMGDCNKSNLSDGGKHFGLIWRAGLWMEYKGFESFNENGNVVTFTNNTQTSIAQDRIGLFATGDGYFPSVSKIYYYKVFDTNDNLVNHFIPVLDSEGTSCMYDEVNNQFFYNQGTGTFTHGNAVDRNYLMNDFYTDTTYKYNEVDTTVEPNLTASAGATLTLGNTYISYLSEEEIEQATNNGWTIQ